MDEPLTARDIRWDPFRTEATPNIETDLEVWVINHPPFAIATWLWELIRDREEYRQTLMACMDALNRSVGKGQKLRAQNERLIAEIRQLMGVSQDAGR